MPQIVLDFAPVEPVGLAVQHTAAIISIYRSNLPVTLGASLITFVNLCSDIIAKL